MSDAHSDIAADERRATEYNSYIEAVLDHLEGKASLDQVIKAAKSTDDVGGGYWGGRTDISRHIEERMAKLLGGDEREWGMLLTSLARDSWASHRYYRAKAISPWPDRFLIHVDYGHGFKTLYCPDADEVVRGADMRTYDCDKYTVAVNVDSDDPQVVWTHCGILGQDGSRPNGSSDPNVWRTIRPFCTD
jgi:hypothetical protein